MRIQTSLTARTTRTSAFLWWCLSCLGCLFLLTACSESDDDAADEFANWQVRNDAFFATLEDSLSRGGDAWRKIKSFTKNESTTTANTEYIYIKVLEQGSGTVCPLYTDTARVSYIGRLIPSANHPQGQVFDQTFESTYTYSPRTTGVIDNLVSNFTDGFATALQHMHIGDRWRVFVPYQLGYGATDRGTVPAYSVMIFDVTLFDFTSPGQRLAPWASRQW